MADYIKREDALQAQNKSMNLGECRKRLERIPAADVRPVVHARWRKIHSTRTDGMSDYECTACLGIVQDVPDDDEHDLVAYCMMCGATMDGE